MDWEDIAYTQVNFHHTDIQRYLDEINHLYTNGGAILMCFKPQDTESFIKAQSSSTNAIKGLDHLLKTFLVSNTVLPTLAKEICATSKDVEALQYSVYGAYEFEGALVDILLTGGSFNRFAGTEDDARQMARAFVDAAIPEGRLSSLVFRIDGPWTRWFFDVAWDHTFVIHDRESYRWQVLCTTDNNL